MHYLNKTTLLQVKITLFLFIGFPVLSFAQVSKNTSSIQLGTSSIDQVVQAMTLKEKARLVVGMNGESEAKSIPKKVLGTSRMHPIQRLGIPSLTLADGPAGVNIDSIRKNDNSNRTYYTTAFPIATLMASTWDTAVVKKVGAALGEEAHEYGVDFVLMPAMDIQRNPLGGRNYEYYSEDPLVSGTIAAAMVKGVQSNGVGATVKHFFANNQETSRHYINTIVGQRAAREIYLRGFEIAVKKSRPWAIMASYNKVNGTYTSQRRDLLTTILRDEWGFEGMVMTDWSKSDSPAVQMKAGTNLIMPGHPEETGKIIQAVKNGSLSVAVLNRNVSRILKTIIRTPAFGHYNYSDKPDLKKDAQIARWAATQGMVLLKSNNNTLPLKDVKKIAVFGFTSYSLLYGGTGSGHTDAAYNVSLDEGLNQAGYSVDKILQSKYKDYLKEEKPIMEKTGFYLAFKRHYGIPEMRLDPSLIKQAALKDDIAILTIGRNAGEGRDRKLKSFYLSLSEENLLDQISHTFHAQGKKVIVVLNIPGPIDVSSWNANADAILVSWLPGQEGGNAIADILSGKVNPSGKLAQTFPVEYSDVPSARYFPGDPARNIQRVTYVDGIYVGYRYYNTFHIKTAYPFGYGLSYTHFIYNDLKLSSSEFYDETEVSVKITNSGDVAGKEVVELYLSAPSNGLKKPSEELKGFVKTKLLQPGESQIAHFTLTPSSLASFDEKRGSWVAASGKYEIRIGASATDIRQKASFVLKKPITVEKVKKALIPKFSVPEFYPAKTSF